MIDLKRLNESKIISNLFSCIEHIEKHPQLNFNGLLDTLKMIYRKHKGKLVFPDLNKLVDTLLTFVFPSSTLPKQAKIQELLASKSIVQNTLALLQTICAANKDYIGVVAETFAPRLAQYSYSKSAAWKMQRAMQWKVPLCDTRETSDNKYVGLANPNSCTFGESASVLYE